MADAPRIPSPCRAICRLGTDNRCDGCGRSIAEIQAWPRLAPGERARVLARVAAWVPREDAARAGAP